MFLRQIYFILILFSFFRPESLASDEPLQEKDESSFIKQSTDDFYFGRMRSSSGKHLWLVMERVTNKNRSLWDDYISVQSNARVIEFAGAHRGKDGTLLQKGSTGDGSLLFKNVLMKTPLDLNEVWVAYITKNAQIPEKIHANDLCMYNPKCIGNKTGTSFTRNIEMFMTVTSSSQGLLTSHMGITASVEGIISNREKRTSLDLHSFAAKVMRQRNPNRQFMLNAPVFAMENLMVKALPGDTFVGTIEMRETLQKAQSMSKEQFCEMKREDILEALRNEACQEADEENYRLERRMNRVKHEQAIKEVVASLPSFTLIKMGQNNRFVVCDDKIASQYSSRLDDDFHRFKNPFPFPLAKPDEQGKGLLKYMEKNPPLLSAKSFSGEREFTLFDPKNSNQVWLTLNQVNRDQYDWLFRRPFFPMGTTHYFAVDLEALAKSRPLIEMNCQDYAEMKSPYHISLSKDDYSDADHDFIQNLKDNETVINVTLHRDFTFKEKDCLENFKKIILEGLQNKPNLRKLTICGNFDTDTFFTSHGVCLYDLNTKPRDLLERAHLAFFTHLEELHVKGTVMGGWRNDAYFCQDFLRYLKESKELKRVVIEN